MLEDRDFSVNVERFTGFADVYDRYRPGPPSALAGLLLALAKCAPDAARVVDFGCGTGLSTRYWAGRAAEAIGVEPTDAMREQAQARGGVNVRYVKGFSHATGLPDNCAQIVTCSQALHWMEPQPTFAEVSRILEKGGVFAAYDYDWPPVTGVWEADAAYSKAEALCRELEARSGVSAGLRFQEKSGHLSRMAASGVFRWTREILLHHEEPGDAHRLLGLFESQGFVQQLRKAGYTDTQLGIDALRQAAQLLPSASARSGADPAQGRVESERDAPQSAQGDTATADAATHRWLWCSRVRVGVV